MQPLLLLQVVSNYLPVSVVAAVVTVEMTTVTTAGKDRRLPTENALPAGGRLFIWAVRDCNAEQIIQLGQN